MMRVATVESSAAPVVERLAAKRPFPRHIVVPFLAGLLVALLGAVVLRIGADSNGDKGEKNRGKAAVKAKPAPQSQGFRAVPSDTAATKKGQTPTKAQLSQAGGPRIGPTVLKLVPVEVRTSVDGEGDGAEGKRCPGEALTDSDPTTCLKLGTNGKKATAEFSFEARRRFSHVMIGLGCSPDEAPRPPIEATIVTEDGSRRYLTMSPSGKEISVDLAGAWTSTVQMEFQAKDASPVGLSGVEFFAFED
jgi:hypothetical protein